MEQGKHAIYMPRKRHDDFLHFEQLDLGNRADTGRDPAERAKNGKFPRLDRRPRPHDDESQPSQNFCVFHQYSFMTNVMQCNIEANIDLWVNRCRVSGDRHQSELSWRYIGGQSHLSEVRTFPISLSHLTIPPLPTEQSPTRIISHHKKPIMKLSPLTFWAVIATLATAAPAPIITTSNNNSHNESTIKRRNPICNIIPGVWQGMDGYSFLGCHIRLAQEGDDEVVVPKDGYIVCQGGGGGSFWVHALGDGDQRTTK